MFPFNLRGGEILDGYGDYHICAHGRRLYRSYNANGVTQIKLIQHLLFR